MKLFRILILVIIGCCACSTSNNASAWNNQMDQMYQCHADAALDSSQMAQELVGTWAWKFVRSTSWSYYESETDFAGFELFIENDGTFSMNMADTLTVSGTWALENSWTTFTLNSQTYVPTLWGDLLYCDPYLMFYSSPADGPDNLYLKQ